MKALEGKAWLDAPSVEPRVTVQLPVPGQINLLVRIPCPTPFPSRLEQAILKKFLYTFSFAPRVIQGRPAGVPGESLGVNGDKPVYSLMGEKEGV